MRGGGKGNGSGQQQQSQQAADGATESTSSFQRGLDSGLAKAAPSAVGPLPEDLSVVLQEAGTFRPAMVMAWQGDSCGRSISGDVVVAGCGMGCSGHLLTQSPTLLSLTRSLTVFAKTCPSGSDTSKKNSPPSFALVHHTGPFTKRILPNWTWNTVG